MSTYTDRFFSPFDLTRVEKKQLNNLDHCMSTCDDIIDAILNKGLKEKVSDALLDILQKGDASTQGILIHKETLSRLKFIHARISEQNIKDEFLTISKELLHRSNVRSQTKDVDEYLQASYEEGETTMKLFLLLLNKDNILEKDEAYLQWVSGRGNVYDDIVDMKEDFVEGTINLHPFRNREKLLMKFGKEMSKTILKRKLKINQLQNICISGLELLKNRTKETQSRESVKNNLSRYINIP